MTTHYSEKEIEELKGAIIGLKINDFKYDIIKGCFIITTDDGELSFRFMADVVKTDSMVKMRIEELEAKETLQIARIKELEELSKLS